MPTMENWRPIYNPMLGLLLGEHTLRMSGIVKNDSRIGSDGKPMEGREIITSFITEINHEKGFFVTTSGTRYQLGKPAKEYVELVRKNDPDGYAEMVKMGYVEIDPATAN